MRREMRSVLLSVVVVSLVLVIGFQHAYGEITLTFGLWDENQKPTMQKIVDAFNAAHEGVTVVLEQTPWTNYWMKLDAAAGAGQAPDIFWMNVYLPKYVTGNVVLPIDDYIKRDALDLSVYIPALVQMYQYEGKQYALPKGMDAVVVACNTALFDQYHIPHPQEGWTWEDMRNLAAQLRDGMKAAGTGEYPIVMELDAQPSHFNFVHQTGGFVISDDYAKSGYDQPATVKAYQKVMDLFEDELLAPYTILSETKGTDLFLSGKGAMVFIGSWKSGVLENSTLGKEGKIQLITMPKQEVSNVSVLGGLGYAIAANTKYPEEAWEFVKFIAGPEGNRIQGEDGIDIPAYIEAQKFYSEGFHHINAGTFMKAAENSVKFPAGPALTKWLGVVNDAVAQIFAGEVSPDKGCAQIYSEMQRMIDETQ
ncbi:MAG: sugar ABC transporter substrate-binding protein [Candidatus Vecturithrix sp.]|nr:sugar ABC transporter substrate-binding protein [Candidatus Vecturithrix sp.]